MTLPSGTRLGPYELVTLLGAGGMGEVYKARDTRLDRTVAIKVLPQRLAADPDRRLRLEREARAISALSHPNICTLHDVGNQDGSEYLVMEYLEGETLAQRLARGPLPLAQMLAVGSEIAKALERAHRQGIVHRDLKPANVMLTRGGTKLLDFGIAKAVALDSQAIDLTTPAGQPTRTPLTAAGVIVGTLHYMAPEQLEGRDVDARADIFALGTLLYEMAAGEPAFSGGSQASLIAAILERQPPPLSARLPLAPVELDRLVALCLAKDPEERWQSVHDVRLQLEAISVQSAPKIAAARQGRRRRWERLAWGAATLALGAALAVSLVRPRSAGRSGSILQLSLLPPAGVSSSGPIGLSPDGRRVAFVGYDADGVAQLFVRALDEPEARRLAGTEDASLPFWSPDGRSLGFFAKRQLKRIELVGGPPRTLSEVADARGGTWGPAGVIVFSPNPGDGLYSIAADGGASTALTHLDRAHSESSHRWPSFLPDGKRVLYLALSGDRERYGVQVIALGETQPRALFPADSGAQAMAGNLLFVRGSTLLAQPYDERTLSLGGTPRPLAEGVWRDPDLDGLRAFAGAGTVVAYRQGGSDTTQLTWFDRDGRAQGTLGAPGVGSVVRLSPDQRRVARSVTEEGAATAGLWMLDEGGGASRLTFNRWNDIYPVWSPDGKRVAFASDRSGTYNLYGKSADGSGDETLLLRSELWNFPEDWSPDGSQLVFTQRDPQTKGDVWLLDLASGKPRPLLRGEADELQPRVSPNGRFLAYTSDESGRNEIYVQTLPLSAAKWQVSSAGGFQPQWRRDGRELYFLAPDLELMAAAVQVGGGAFVSARPQPLFLTRSRRSNLKGAAGYFASADGRRFLIDSQTDLDSSSPIHLLLDSR